MGVFSVGSVVNKRVLTGLCGFLLVVSSMSYAGMNPFKKSKNYVFGPDVAWYEHNDVAVKSGSVRDGSHTNFYHLNIDNEQLLLRLGRNDPSGELENTRILENLSITEVNVDGRPLPLFNWCLQNQQNPGKKLKQNAIVANGVCVNTGGGGDFIIKLDKGTSKLLYNAKMLEFVVEPYGRGVKLSYSMLGYAPIMDKINKPAPKPVAVVAPKPKPQVKPKPRPKPKSKPKPKPIKICYAKAPVEFKSQIKSVSYPCNDKAKKASAESAISTRVGQEKQKKAAAENEARQARQQDREDSKREAEWESKQTNLWVSRCKKHWAKNVSPCYCEKYLSQAPAGIINTCGK